MNDAQLSPIQNTVLVVGRVTIAIIYLGSLANKIMDPGSTIETISGALPVPQFWYVGALFLLGVGALSVLLGIYGRFGASCLALFVITAAIFFHPFWKLEGDAAMPDMIHFLKNLSLFGGLPFVAVFGTGAFSVDRLWTKKADAA